MPQSAGEEAGMLQWTPASERRFTRLGALNDARVLVANPYHGARRAVRAVLEPLAAAQGLRVPGSW